MAATVRYTVLSEYLQVRYYVYTNLYYLNSNSFNNLDETHILVVLPEQETETLNQNK